MDLGLTPHILSDSLLDSIIGVAVKYRDRIDASVFLPQVFWREATNVRVRQAVVADGVTS